MAEQTVTHYKVEDLAAKWCLSTKFVRREIWNGKLRAVRFGKAVRVPAEEVERYERSLASA
jgi:excisionase family DNA binding protein